MSGLADEYIHRADGSLVEKYLNRGDGTVQHVAYDPEGVETVNEILTDYDLPPLAPATDDESIAALTTALVTPAIHSGDLTPTQTGAVVVLYPQWAVGLDVEAGDILGYAGGLVEVVQAHTTQTDWSPHHTPALFKVHRTPDMTDWIPGIDVAVDEEWFYNGYTYKVLQAHTTQIGWEPPITPSLWEDITPQPQTYGL